MDFLHKLSRRSSFRWSFSEVDVIPPPYLRPNAGMTAADEISMSIECSSTMEGVTRTWSSTVLAKPGDVVRYKLIDVILGKRGVNNKRPPLRRPKAIRLECRRRVRLLWHCACIKLDTTSGNGAE